MKKSVYKFNGHSRIFLAFLCVGLLVSIGFLINYKTRAEAESNHLQTIYNNSLKSFKPQGKTAPAVKVGERASAWIKLEPGKSLETRFYGNDSAISSLESDLAEPTAQASADVNADGYNDLISGFRNAAGGGLIALHRANKEAFEPQDEQVLADLKRGVFPASFEKDAIILDVPTVPDFIFAGRFSQDSALDLVFASRGGNSIYIMSSDGAGSFNAAREIALDGEITALAADTLDASKIYAGLVVASRNENSSTISVFDGTAELAKTTPRSFSIEGDVTSLLLANPDGAAPGKDVFGVADGGIFTMPRIGDPNSSVHKIELPMKAVDIAVGEFIRDREARAEIAVLSEDGNVSYLTRGTLDTRPFTTEEIVAQWKQNGGRGRIAPVSKTRTNKLSDDWTSAETYQLGVYSPGGNSARALQSSARTLQKAYITGGETEDLLVTDSTDNRVEVLFKEPETKKNRAAFTGETKIQDVDLAAFPTAVFPMRLNVMGQQGFVVFSQGSLEPTPVIAAPNATFTVTKTADTNDGACNADCSLREAIVAANAAPGADMITFAVNGTHQLTIAGVENAAAAGDLDITQALTIVGNGAANTIIQGGASVGTGIDKVLSVNPLFTSAFATSFSNFTVRFGRNPSTFTVDGFGGGFDWEGSGTGTMNVSGCIVTDNRTTDGDGGGITATNSIAGSGGFTASNTTISNNMPARAGANSPLGGGIFVGQITSYFFTTVTINNNNVSGSGGQGQGGGIYAFGPTSASSSSFLTNSTVTNNSAPSDGGGILTTQRLDINPLTTISNNSSGRFGGGIFINHSNVTSTFSKLTMTGNAATTNGGAIYLGSSTTANVINMSYSRIVGNTGGGFKGLAVDAGTANVQNNWWGCNTGPSAAPCDTAGVVGTGTANYNPWLRYTHTASPATIVVGQSTTLTASFLTNSAGTAIAASNLDVLIGLTIAFNNAVRGTISNAQGTIQSSGTATATFTGTSVGAGSANAAVDNGTATASITITQAATTTTVTSNVNPSAFGQTVTFTATVSVTAPGSGTPTGTVQFKDGATTIAGCGAVALSGGTAQCMTNTLTVGSHTITAVYSGDTNFTGSTSSGLTQTVNKANTTTTITADTPDPSIVGQAYTVTVSLAVTSPGAGTPTGTITVSDGTNTCTITLPATSCNLTSTTAGAKTLTATYNGDANFNASPASAGVPHTVNAPPDLTITKTHTGNFSRGQTNAQYTITVTNSGGSSASGTVTVVDTLPAGLTATAISGTGWSCTLGTLTCTRSDALAASSSYPVITLTIIVASNAPSQVTNTASVSGGGETNTANDTATDPTTVMVATAATVTISGQVTTITGRGIGGVRLSLTDSAGNVRTATTTSFGYYRFDDVQVGETYILSASGKHYTFSQPLQVLNVNEEADGVDFIANSEKRTRVF